MEEKKLTRISSVPAREEGKAQSDNPCGPLCAMARRCALESLFDAGVWLSRALALGHVAAMRHAFTCDMKNCRD